MPRIAGVGALLAYVCLIVGIVSVAVNHYLAESLVDTAHILLIEFVLRKNRIVFPKNLFCR